MTANFVGCDNGIVITEKMSFLRHIYLLKYWEVKVKMSGICFII